jgi:hypothetical protein
MCFSRITLFSTCNFQFDFIILYLYLTCFKILPKLGIISLKPINWCNFFPSLICWRIFMFWRSALRTKHKQSSSSPVTPCTWLCFTYWPPPPHSYRPSVYLLVLCVTTFKPLTADHRRMDPGPVHVCRTRGTFFNCPAVTGSKEPRARAVNSGSAVRARAVNSGSAGRARDYTTRLTIVPMLLMCQ